MTRRVLTEEQETRARDGFESQEIEGTQLTLDEMREIVAMADEQWERELPVREALRQKARELGRSFLNVLEEDKEKARTRGLDGGGVRDA